VEERKIRGEEGREMKLAEEGEELKRRGVKYKARNMNWTYITESLNFFISLGSNE
jgi:hypothetical protein